jgi:hypothetical protein
MTWQPAAMLAADIELLLTGYIRTSLASRPESYASGVSVSNVVPPTMPNRFVQVRRDGGQVRNLRDTARVAIRCWAATEKDATDLARLVNALLFAAPKSQPVLSVVHQSGPLPIADGSTKPQRYSLFEIATRVTVLED